MRKILMLTLTGIFSLALSVAAWSDTLTLRDGTVISGTLVSKTKTRISFKDDQGVVRKYSTTKVSTLEIAKTGQIIHYQKAAAAKVVQVKTLPAGTELVVRTSEEIDSKNAEPNQTFSAKVEEDVLGDDGKILIPKGSSALLVIREVSGGGVTGSPEILLDIDSVIVAGQKYQVSTEELKKKSATGLGANVRTAEMVGGGAAAGAILGAIIGKGKGAAIGAAAGAAAGAGVQILVKGKQVRVPAETVLNFKLDQPAQLQASR